AGKLAIKQKVEGKKAIRDADRRQLPEKGKEWEHWQIPFDTDPDWPQSLARAVTEYRDAWRAKMTSVNACIAGNAEQEELVDQPRIVPGVLRVSGPFTVEASQPLELSTAQGQTFRESQNLLAYLDRMVKLLRCDGVRFPDNRQMRFTWLETLFESGNS